MQNGPGWTGGDGTYSLLLPDGTNLWMWSDSYIGKVNPTTRLRSNYLFTAHNSLTIQNQTANSPGCKTGYLVMYNAKAHPEFTDSNGILLTYNVNALNSKNLVCANDYSPRFLRITIPGVTDANDR